MNLNLKTQEILLNVQVLRKGAKVGVSLGKLVFLEKEDERSNTQQHQHFQ